MSWWDQLYQSQLQFPSGGVWGNIIAAPPLAAAAVIGGWLARHRIAAFFHGSFLRTLEHQASVRARELYQEVDEHLFADRLPDLGPEQGAPDESTETDVGRSEAGP